MKAELIALGAVLGILAGLTLAARHATHPTPQTILWCEARKPFVLDGIEYPAGDQYPCRWLKLEQDV